MRAFIVTVGSTPVAVFSTRVKAEALVSLIESNSKARAVVRMTTIDGLDARISAGELPFVAVFDDVDDPNSGRVAMPPFNRGVLEQNSFDYDSVTKRFRVLVWAADAAEAATRAETRRDAFSRLLP